MSKKLLFLLLTVTCATFTMNAQNLLANANPGFEGIASTPSNNSPYDWWGFYNNSNSAATLTDQSAIVHGGTHAAKVVVATAAGTWEPQLTNGNTINLTIGHSYTVTFWIKADNGGSTIAGTSNVYNVNGGAPFGSTMLVTTSWQQYSQTFTADAATPTYQLWINLGGSVNTYYVDDASVVDNTVLGIEDFAKNDKISFYPNPVNDNLNISSDATIKSITISDIVGKTVRTIKNAENIQSINLSDLKQGMYILSTDINKQFKFLKN